MTILLINKKMKKIILLAFLIIASAQLTFAQTVIAKLKFEDAETAFTEGDYSTVITKLEDAEKLFGKINPPILYLRIMAQKQLLDAAEVDYTDAFNILLQSLRKNCETYLKQYETLKNNEDKYRDVYTAFESIDMFPKTPEFFQAMKYENKTQYSTCAQLLNKAAAKGDGYAYTRLGLPYYREWFETPLDYAKATEYFTKAIDLGDASAMYYMANIYYSGYGVKRDKAKAFELYNKSAAKGNGAAMYEVAYAYDYGYGITKDETKAFEWYLKSAEKGYIYGIVQTGKSYWLGWGVTANDELAMQWFQKGVKRGDAEAFKYVGSLYYDGSGVEKDRAKAFEWYTKAAEKGSASAMHSVGDMYYRGIHVKLDYALAVSWYTKSAEGGYARGSKDLGKMYAEGYYIAKDFNLAVKWCTISAEEHYNAESMYQLGYLYENADKYQLKGDYDAAFKWYSKAADGQNGDAMNALSSMYKNGRGVKKDKQ